jgi:DNA-binding transcriptional regulator YiaG
MKIPIKCSCGAGVLEPVVVTNYSLKDELGLDIVVRRLVGLRCSACGLETLHGKTAQSVRHAAAAAIIARDEQLGHELATYLRHYLGCTQQELAHLMDTSRKTVNTWENGGKLDSAFDYMLRGLVYSRLKKAVPDIDVVMGLQPAALLGHAHTKPAKSRRIILDAIPELPAAA